MTWPRPSLRLMLLLLNAGVVGALLWLSVQAWQALKTQQHAQAHQVELAEAVQLSKQADMLHDALHADVLVALLVGQVRELSNHDVQQRVRDDALEFGAAFQALARADIAEELRERVARNHGIADAYALHARELVQRAAGDRAAAIAALPEFEAEFKVLVKALDAQGAQLSKALKTAQQRAASDGDAARESLLWSGALVILVTSAFAVAISLTIQLRTRRLSEVAQAIADGDLERRVGHEGGAELGPLGSAIDQMASSLNQMISTMRDEALNASFEKQLAGALDMTDREAQVATVAARAMGEVSVAHAMELLISDSSLAHMARAAEHPNAGAPGCRVGSPYDCVAVRRGNLITFDDSEALDACPQLRGRPCGGLSAVCVPVTFMGRAIGVLHSTGPVDLPMTPDQVRKVGNLGTQLGMRLGTVRAFEKSQIQARTDGLTGLPNRRTLERQMHLMAASDKPFALVMCDLDHFKRLNDTFGHAAGDSALRVFSDVLRHSLREADLVGRWGGEEFVFVLAQSHSHAAAEMVGRLRARLAATLQLGKVPEFTASFGVADSTLTREPDRLVQLADVALYQAKAQGRDRACLAEPSMEFELDEHRRMLRGTDGATEASSGLASMFAEEA